MLPGVWAATSAAVLGGVACWLWLAAPAPAPNSATAATPALAAVAPAEIEGALITMDGSPAMLARFRERPDTCAQPLAWVTIARAGSNQPVAKIRLRSGDYFSPPFDLPETPLRVAIPYPAPYEAGQGELMVVGAASGAAVALTPAWVVPPGPEATRHVIWQPVKRCAETHG